MQMSRGYERIREGFVHVTLEPGGRRESRALARAVLDYLGNGLYLPDVQYDI